MEHNLVLVWALASEAAAARQLSIHSLLLVNTRSFIGSECNFTFQRLHEFFSIPSSTANMCYHFTSTYNFDQSCLTETETAKSAFSNAANPCL